MTEEFSFPPRKLNFTGSLKFDRSLSIKPRKHFEINNGRQAVECLYFGSCGEISGHSKRSVPTERMASYISEKVALKSWHFAVLPSEYGKSLIFQSFVAAKELLNSAKACVLVICPLTSISQDQIAEANAPGITCVSLHDSEEVKQNTFQLVFSSVERAMEEDVRQIGSKSTNHSLIAWRREG